ncbi:MAG: hypothetical protein ACRDJM_08770 [Actinomycetota bacterium]
MQNATTIRRFAAGAFAAAALLAVLVQGRPATTITARAQRCGLTTLDGTIVFKDGTLRCGPGEALRLRQELAKAKPARRGTAIASFVALTDFQLPDEESPLRGEFLDKCGDHPAKAAFRWNDALLPALLNSEVDAANRIGAGPVTGRPFDFAVQLGDASENQQYNEVRAFIDLLDGGTLVDPDSGAEGYEGNQGRDPYASPVAGRSLLDLANEPFYAPGLRRPDGTSLPWFTVMGNHDMKVRGTMPNDNDAWKTFARAWVTGQIMVNDLPPDQQQRVCADPAVLLDPTFWAELAARPNTVRLISPDPDRRLVDREEWIAEHAKTRGLPVGHGFTARSRCKGADGTPLDRACYTWDMPSPIPGSPPIHYIALDTNADEGLDEGNLDQAQWNWLNEDLKKHSACYYASADATGCTKTGNPSSIIVVFSHHTASTATNETPRLDGAASYDGAALQDLFLRFPNFVVHANGHTHHNKVWAHARPSGKGGYFEVNTSAVADFPHQGRTIELVDNHDGTLSVYAVNFDAAAPVDPATMRWAEDRTPETQAPFGGGERNVNEELLASIARWVGANDPQSGAATIPPDLSTPADRNVELILKHPTGGTRRPNAGVRPPRLPTVGPRPPFPFGFPFPFPGKQPLPNFGLFPPVVRNPNGVPGIPAFPQSPSNYGAFGLQTRSLGAPARTSLQLREIVMTALAAAGAMWLIRARIRRNQIGI